MKNNNNNYNNSSNNNQNSRNNFNKYNKTKEEKEEEKQQDENNEKLPKITKKINKTATSPPQSHSNSNINKKNKDKKPKLNRFIETPPLISSNKLNINNSNSNNNNSNNGRKTPPLLMLSPPQSLNNTNSPPSNNSNNLSNETTTTTSKPTTTTTTTTTTSNNNSTQNVNKEIPGYYFDVDKNRYFKLTKELQQMLLEKKKKEKEEKELPIKIKQTTNNSSIKFKNLSNLLIERELSQSIRRIGLDYHIKDIMIGNYFTEFKKISKPTSSTCLSIFGSSDNNDNKIITKGIISSTRSFITIDWINCHYNNKNNNNNKKSYENLFNKNQDKNYDYEIKIENGVSSSFSMNSEVSSIRTNLKYPSIVSICTLGDGNKDGSVWIYSINSQPTNAQCLRNLMLDERSVWCSEWNPQNEHLISIGGNGICYLYDLNNQKLTNKFLSKSDIFIQDFNTQGNLLFNGSRDGIVRTLDIRFKNTDFNNVSNINNSNNNNNGGNNNNNIEINIINKKLNPHNSSISFIKSLIDDNYLIIGSINGVISKWDRRVNKSVIQYLHNENSGSKRMGISISPDQQYLSACGDDGFIRIWNTSTGSLIKTIGPFSSLSSLQFIDYFSNQPSETSNHNNNNNNNNNSTFFPSLCVSNGNSFSFYTYS
ncbi:hypothetical protein ACTFIU_003845 [Dictyostelium citrinum]